MGLSVDKNSGIQAQIADRTEHSQFLSQIQQVCDAAIQQSTKVKEYIEQNSRFIDGGKLCDEVKLTTPKDALALTCQVLKSQNTGWVGGPMPYALEEGLSQGSYSNLSKLVDKVTPVSSELAQAIRDLKAGTNVRETRYDLPYKMCDVPFCSPTDCTQYEGYDPIANLPENSPDGYCAPDGHYYKPIKETYVSNQSINDFISTAKKLSEEPVVQETDTSPKLSEEPVVQETDTSSSSFNRYGLAIVAVGVIGIAAAAIYSHCTREKQEQDKSKKV